MRPDLAKLTTEHERVGSSNPSLKHGGRVRIVHDPDHDYPDEYGGFRPSSRRRYPYPMDKEFTDVLSPLRGTLRKNLGRPWDKIYSEFCKVLDRRSISGYHIWTHLMDMVSTKAYRGADGHFYEIPSYYGVARRVRGFYVHPTTGILCHVDRKRKR